jgi:flavodoxin
MKKFSLIFTIMAAMFFSFRCSGEKAQKVLVLYYTQTGNTKVVAEHIAGMMQADIEEIVPVNPYDGDFAQTIERCMKEREEGVIPEIQPIKSKLSKYDVIFIGYPVWFGTYAPPVIKFLQDYDLSGKEVVPFCTFGSGGLESSMADMQKAQPKAKIECGFGIRAARLDKVTAEVSVFLKENDFIEGKYTKLDAFSEQHEVTEEENAIFEAATGDYPMLHAKAKTVATRAIHNGTEYFFIAVDIPRVERPDMPPAGEIQVYVNAVKGEAPVFTRVVR